MAARLSQQRSALLEATEQALEQSRKIIAQGKLRRKEKIRTCVNKIVRQEKRSGFTFEITDAHFHFDCAHSAKNEIYVSLCKKLEKIGIRVRQGKLKGKILTSVKKLLDKKLMTFFKLDVRDDHVSCSVSDETLAKQAAFDKLNDKLHHIVTLVTQGKYGGKDKIGRRIGKVINQYNMEKHFTLTFTDDDFTFQVDTDKVAAEAVLDGIYIIPTSVCEQRLRANQTVRTYKSLSQVEPAFGSVKSMALQVRPIHHCGHAAL